MGSDIHGSRRSINMITERDTETLDKERRRPSGEPEFLIYYEAEEKKERK